LTNEFKDPSNDDLIQLLHSSYKKYKQSIAEAEAFYRDIGSIGQLEKYYYEKHGRNGMNFIDFIKDEKNRKSIINQL
jgi:hypothetical protein